MKRYIIHCDMNNYFASVEMIDNPYLELIPLVVCGDIKLRHGIVLSKNNMAREYGIATGESVYDAKKKYRDVVCITADYKKYLLYTQKSRAIYKRYSDLIYPYGLDEAWIDVSASCNSIEDAMRIGREIKKVIKDELKLGIAVGVSFNYIFSKLGSDQKNDDIYVIDKENYENITEYLPAFNLLFVGSKTRSTLKKLNILTIGDLRRAEVNKLKYHLGKKGEMLYHFAHGDDSEFKPVVENDDEIKSISNTITSPKDITSFSEIEAFVYLLSQATSKRLIKHHLKGKTIGLKLKFNDFSTLNKQLTLPNYVDSQIEIFNAASAILRSFEYELPIRSFNLRISKLAMLNFSQSTLFKNETDEQTEKVFKQLQNKYGNIRFEESSNLKDWEN